ncbi:MAG TPA: hypothetical protein VFL70_03050 [Bacteroidia bacterium]|nr:hypothetical protein [Bacteroidia bacterium]
MLNLRKVIQTIESEDAQKLIFWLKQRDADKCVQLFNLLRDESIDELNVADELGLRPSGYYSLKSRLYASIQEFMSHGIPESDIDLLRSISGIPHLLFDTPRELAIAQLLKMEKDLKEHDMPYALTIVYNALKKLNRFSKKYFDYTQLYNKHVAYTIALDKTQELLSDFNKSLGEFLMSRDEKHYNVLLLIKDEMYNYAQLYTSHRLTVYKNIMDVEFLLFTPTTENIVNNEVFEILGKIEKVITDFKSDANYSFLFTLLDFLWFEYYNKNKSLDNADKYFLKTNKKLPNFLLYNFCSVPTLFLISKAERYLEKRQEQELYEESMFLSSDYTPDKEDIPNYINYVKFKAIAFFYVQKYNECISILNELIGSISFRNFQYAEIEMKLFLAICYLMVNKSELTDGIVKNVKRKLREYPVNEYENARIFTKILSGVTGPTEKEREEKVLNLTKRFLVLNHSEFRMLDYIRFNKDIIKILTERDKVVL